MARRIYLRSEGSPALTPSTWNFANQINPVSLPATLTKNTGSAMTSKTEATGTANPTARAMGRHVIGPLKAQTITGTVKGQMRGSENNAGANATLALAVKVIKADTTDRGVLLAQTASDSATAGNELATSLTNAQFKDASESASISLTSQAVSDGDYLVIEWGFRSATSTSRNITLSYGNDSATDLPEDTSTTAANNPWVEFSFDIAFLGSGDGSASGVGTATGVGASTAQGTGSSDGSSTPAATGAAIASAAGTASGSTTPAGVGETLAVGAGSAAGSGSASAAGSSTAESSVTASGGSTPAAVGNSTAEAWGSSFGQVEAGGVGEAFAIAAASAAGTSNAQAIFITIASGAGSANGSATDNAILSAQASAIATADGLASLDGVSISITSGVGVASGVTSDAIIAGAIASGLGSVAGSASSAFAGHAINAAIGSSISISTVEGVGESGEGGSIASAAGNSSASFIAQSISSGVGASQGAANAVGQLLCIASASFSSVGLSICLAEILNSQNTNTIIFHRRYGETVSRENRTLRIGTEGRELPIARELDR